MGIRITQPDYKNYRNSFRIRSNPIYFGILNQGYPCIFIPAFLK
jgi:hypothetical protein